MHTLWALSTLLIRWHTPYHLLDIIKDPTAWSLQWQIGECTFSKPEQRNLLMNGFQLAIIGLLGRVKNPWLVVYLTWSMDGIESQMVMVTGVLYLSPNSRKNQTTKTLSASAAVKAPEANMVGKTHQPQFEAPTLLERTRPSSTNGNPLCPQP